MPTMIDHALALARDGYRVFPLSPNTRFPMKDLHWKEAATSDEGTIAAWWSATPDANIGIATGRGLLVIDADCKNGKPGLESLAMLDALGLPAGKRVRTATGGIHVYLRVPEGVGLSIGAESVEGFPGIDYRCDGGYVVGEGSVVDGQIYQPI